MKTLMRYVTPIVSTLLLAFGVVGCGTTSGTGPTITPARVESVTRLAAYSTAKLALAKDPKNIVTLTKVSNGLNELVASGNYDLATAVTIANANGLGELTSSEGQIALTALPVFIDLIAGESVNLNDSQYAKAVIVGAAGGFKMALPAAGGAPAARVGALTPATEMRRLQKEAEATRR